MFLRFSLVVVAIWTFTVADRSVAQNTPPDGCSLPLPAAIKQGLDGVLLHACTRHDQCWRQSSTCDAPNGFGTKLACDAIFWADLMTVCTAARGALLAGGWSSESVREFADDCEDAADGAYLGVSLNLWTFAERQCALPPMNRGLPWSHLGTCSESMCVWLANFHWQPGVRDWARRKGPTCCPPQGCQGHDMFDHVP